MGFEAKIVFVLPGTAKADQQGPNGEAECAVWKDSNWGIDFGHITRLEKLTGERFQHLRSSFHPFRRAGICVMNRFLHSCVFVDFENRFDERCAPEIVVPKPFFAFADEEMGNEPTVKIGGRIYLSVNERSFKGCMGNDTLVEDHNAAAGKPEALRRLLKSGKWHPMVNPPLLWATCAELADCLDKAENEKHEVWEEIQADSVSKALFLSWRESLRNLGTVDARSVFRFS